MSRSKSWSLAAAIALAVGSAAIAVTAASGGGSAPKKPIIIGVAMDLSSQMSPYDTPALYIAQARAIQINAKGGVLGGRKIVFKICNTQLKKQKECAAQLIAQGAAVGMVTCDVEYAAPSTQEFINKGLLALSPCIGTDQQGPKRFGTKGRLAFTFGSPAQEEGAAMAEYSYSRGWHKAIIVKDNLLAYFKNIADAFKVRFKELGGTIVDEQEFTSFDKTINNAITKVAPEKADVICFGTAFADLPTFVAGVRSLGNNTPIINSWGGDGNYWWTSNPQVTNYYYVTYGSIYGHDPSPLVNSLVKQVTKQNGGHLPATGSFVPGADLIDGLVAAIRQTGGTNSVKLANAFEHFRGLPTTSGKITFTKQLHSVTGRAFRVMKVQRNHATFLRLWKTKKLANIG
jgi:branched-chain amino acid transport system substrate-binding protein